MTEEKIKYENLTTGFSFTPSTFKMDAETAALYLKATDDHNPEYEGKLVPPMAIAALAMKSMAEKFDLLPGTVHVSQQLEFLNTASIDETLTSYASVARKVARGKFHMLTIGIKVLNQQQETVITGEIGFILPLNQGALP